MLKMEALTKLATEEVIKSKDKTIRERRERYIY
jgi:hypothetical protein